ncbi:metallophosphoesterase [Lacticaseibacillus nasuensis]|nr:metallophosphoesterase [Lacticaseibacillus nasuensis]
MLTMNEQGFKILQLTDIHIGEAPFNAEDQATFAALKENIPLVDPDLIVISGDLIWSDGVDRPQRGYQALVDIFNELDYPLAITYGNHDSEQTLDRSALRKLETGFTHRVTKQHAYVDPRGKESYTVEIGQAGKITNVLYIFDSGDNAPFDVEGYDWVSTEAIAWYEATHAEYLRTAGQTVDLVFLHIPVPEYANAATHIVAGKWWEMNPRIASPELNTGLFAHLRFNQHIAGIFCGHDHDNNFEGRYMGIPLIYGNVSGYNCYGDLPRGYRVINLTPKTMETVTQTYRGGGTPMQSSWFD